MFNDSTPEAGLVANPVYEPKLAPQRRAPRLGLVLGSGAARGWAHVGVIRALEQAGIRPDIVCGTSVGALVGAAYATGEFERFCAGTAGMRRADVISFTAGVGENSPLTRAGALDTLGFAGVEIDPERNGTRGRGIRVISTDASRVTVLVVPTNEELEIARQALLAAAA